MKKAIVFDLDGTLLSTLADLTNSVNYAMTQLNLNVYTETEVRSMIGNGVAVLMKRALTEKNMRFFDDALKFQRQYYALHGSEHTKPYDGICQLLGNLKKEFTVIVHTNKDENIAKPLCDKLLQNKVDFVCGTVSDSQTKPNAQRLLQLLQTLGNPKAVYCGDSEVDVQTARNANLPCISVTWGFRDKDFLATQGATHFAATPEEVQKLALLLTK
ncbi:MAG: HAD family hydrolase [Candidatus Fimimonas sp.]